MDKLIGIHAFALVLLIACSPAPESQEPSKPASQPRLQQRSLEQNLGTVFHPVAADSRPQVEQIDFSQLDLLPEMDAIWGATGRDDKGAIYFGVSSHGGQRGTSQLVRYNPYSGELKSLGDTVSQLVSQGVAPDNVQQNKLHSKIVAADDGYLYFSSFDEGGESQSQLTLPTWGGHLWRTRPSSDQWQHLAATPHALVALQARGRFVYALGYWGHEIYQYDVVSGVTRSVSVDSATAHVSRNFLVDSAANVYVPKVATTEDGFSYASLEQYDHRLNWIASYPMTNYHRKEWHKHHGITGHAEMANGDIYFVTHQGQLYRIVADGVGLDKLVAMGPMHPKGKATIESLFSLDGDKYLGAVARSNRAETAQWLTYDIELNQAAVHPLPTIPANRLIYGSVTRDDEGAMYLVGSHWQGRHGKPVAWKIKL
ncbi:hypothetical protein IC617_09850 [Neiella sp. HB171785]|uniref:Uncharacterized protein n=1 Tax=Neiella litorisoli TaxID=2771431 RepID=A0A8J6UJ19_9GAMM|nr:hypothetical protein [Neiella litorisoli]MBD1389733.1 hypothetical protein [Neiella litorisoli]